MVTIEQLLKQIYKNSKEIHEMLEDNLYITCFKDSEISIVYVDLPGCDYKKQAEMAYPKVIEFIKSNKNIVETLIREKYPDIQTLDNVDVDTLCDIVYEITESKEFENFMLDFFEEDEAVADYARSEFDYDIYIHDYIHVNTGRYDDNGEPYTRLNPRYYYE